MSVAERAHAHDMIIPLILKVVKCYIYQLYYYKLIEPNRSINNGYIVLHYWLAISVRHSLCVISFGVVVAEAGNDRVTKNQIHIDRSQSQ